MSKPKTPPDATRQAQRAAEARARQVPLPHGLDPTTVGATAALFVGQYRNTHRTGPTWREVAEHLHPDCANTCGPQTDRAEKVVPRVHSEQIVRQLIQAGWLEATREPRFADLGRRGHEDQHRQADLEAGRALRRPRRASRPRSDVQQPSPTSKGSTHRAHGRERETPERAQASSPADPANHRGASRDARARAAGFRSRRETPCETLRETPPAATQRDRHVRLSDPSRTIKPAPETRSSKEHRVSARRKEPKDVEHELWRLYEHAVKDEWEAKDRSPEWHEAAQTMALTAQAAMQAQAMQAQQRK